MLALVRGLPSQVGAFSAGNDAKGASEKEGTF